jgi:hypothetical protein
MIVADSDFFLLELKPNSIKNAGLGVFAKVDLPEGIIIAKYRSSIFLKEFKNKLTLNNDKCINLNEDAIIVGTNCLVAYINDIINVSASKKNRKLTTYKNIEHNCYFQKFHHKIFVITMKDIKVNEKLFVEYGLKYWQTKINEESSSDNYI